MSMARILIGASLDLIDGIKNTFPAASRTHVFHSRFRARFDMIPVSFLWLNGRIVVVNLSHEDTTSILRSTES